MSAYDASRKRKDAAHQHWDQTVSAILAGSGGGDARDHISVLQRQVDNLEQTVGVLYAQMESARSQVARVQRETAQLLITDVLLLLVIIVSAVVR